MHARANRSRCRPSPLHSYPLIPVALVLPGTAEPVKARFGALYLPVTELGAAAVSGMQCGRLSVWEPDAPGTPAELVLPEPRVNPTRCRYRGYSCALRYPA